MVQASSANAASTICKGAVALMWIVTREIESWPVPLSDGSCEFGERGRDAPMLPCFAAEFVVAAMKVLHQCVASNDHPGGVVAFEAAHRPEPCLQAAVVSFDPVVRVLLGVVEHARDQLLDGRAERRGSIGHDLDRFAMGTERGVEEPTRGHAVASRRDVHVGLLSVWLTPDV